MDIPVAERKEVTNLYFLIILIIALAITAIRLWKAGEEWLGAGFGLLAIVGAISVIWGVVMMLLLS